MHRVRNSGKFASLPRPDSSNSLASLRSGKSGGVDRICSKESVLSLADIRSLDDLSLSEFSGSTTTYDPICTASETVANSRCQWAEASQTLIFLDWDDTLFPTSEIIERWGFTSRFEAWADIVLSVDQERLVDKWCNALELYLKTTCSLSNNCVIVTNARRPWVTECIDRFCPRLKPLFERYDGPRVVYANEAAKRSGRSLRPGNPVRWSNAASPEERRLELTSAKLAAMRHEAKSFYSKYPKQTWKNIISVGDAMYECDAAQELAFCRRSPEHERLRLKTIVTTAEPMMRDLTYRLSLATLLWPAQVHLDEDMHIDMNASPEKLQSHADALKMPELHNLIRPTPVSEEDEEALAAEFDEVAIAVHNRVYQ
jgi:hypothetical protein